MSITVANIITNLDTYIGDTSTDRISQAERLQALTEGAVWLNEQLGNDDSIKTYKLNFFDTINYYKVTSSITDLLTSADLRRGIKDHTQTATPISARQIAEDIANNDINFQWAIDRRDNDRFIAVTMSPKNGATMVASFDSLTADGGTWEADTTNSDATNVTADSNEYEEGSGSLNFDVDVSQSGNNIATIYNSSLNQKDLSSHEDLGSMLLEVYLPDVTEITSVSLTWGSSDSAYWSATVTTDIDGASFSNGWNTVKINWSDATITGSPDSSEIDYIKVDVNYGAGQGDDTDFRVDYLRIANPEELTFFYNSWDVGTNTGGAAIKAYTATTDIPYYSGKYDQYKYAHAHKAASILFKALRLYDDAVLQEREANLQISQLKNLIPKSQIPENHSFKVYGVNFNKRRRNR